MSKKFTSCIKVNGVPLLPPIITPDLRKYIKSVKEKAIQIEKMLADKKRKKLRVNMWTQVNSESGLFECGQDETIMEWTAASTMTVGSCSSSAQTDLYDERTLETVTLYYPVRKENITKKLNKSRFSATTKGKWTSCPSRIGTSSTIQNETVSEGPKELKVTESYSDEWKRWMSLPDVYDMTSSVTSESSQEYIRNVNVTNRMANLEISPDRQKSYTLVRPSKYLIDYIKKKAYEYSTTSHLCHKNKSYTVLEPSKFLLDYVKNKGYVGPVEEYVPEQSSEGSSSEWKRWMSLPEVYDMTSSVTSDSSQEYTRNVNMTDRMTKLEISPERQKSYTLVKPSKYLVDYVKKKAYEYGTTSHLCHKNKSYTVLEPSKFLLDYGRNKGYVGPVEEYVPEQSSPGSSKISSIETQSFVSSSFSTAPIKCQKCRNENCLCGEELPASYQTQELKNRAATKINAAVRGYLVRRLMKTRHVQQCLDTMRYTLQCHIALDSKSKDDCDDRDVELRLRIMRQLLNSCEEFYNIFFGSTRREQLKIIANDRLLLSE